MTQHYTIVQFGRRSSDILFAGRKHPPDHTPQSVVFQRRRNALFVTELLRDRIASGVRPFFDPNIDPESRWQRLFEANPHS